MARTIVIDELEGGRWRVHLRGTMVADFNTLLEAKAYAEDTKTKHGGTGKCRIVIRDQHGRGVKP
jgi:hypothetical protein